MATGGITVHDLDRPYWALRLTFGLVPIIAGVDKFFNLLTNWTHYLSPSAMSLLPISPQAFMGLVGIVEIVVGAMVLSDRFTRIGSFIASAWLVCVALNLLGGGFYDIAVRDLGLAVGAYTLGVMHSARLFVERETFEAPRRPATRPIGEPPRPAL